MSPITFNIKNPEQKSVEEFYKSETEQFPWFADEKLFFQEPLNKFRMSRIKEEVLHLKPSSILDVGCGNAMLIKSILSDNSYKPQFVAGIDISLKGLRAGGRWQVETPNLGVYTIENYQIAKLPNHQSPSAIRYSPSFICSNAANLPFQSNTFDCVVCTETLEHIFNLSDVLSEINRVLKPSGKLIVTVPNLFCFDSIEGEFGIITKLLMATNLAMRTAQVVRECLFCHCEQMRSNLKPLNKGSSYETRTSEVYSWADCAGLSPLFKYGINTHLHKMLPKRWKETIKKSKFKIIKEFPIYIFPYLPYFFEGLKNLEAKIFQNKNFKQLFQNYEQILSKVLFFRFVGQLHCFVASKY